MAETKKEAVEKRISLSRDNLASTYPYLRYFTTDKVADEIVQNTHVIKTYDSLHNVVTPKMKQYTLASALSYDSIVHSTDFRTQLSWFYIARNLDVSVVDWANKMILLDTLKTIKMIDFTPFVAFIDKHPIVPDPQEKLSTYKLYYGKWTKIKEPYIAYHRPGKVESGLSPYSNVGILVTPYDVPVTQDNLISVTKLTTLVHTDGESDKDTVE